MQGQRVFWWRHETGTKSGLLERPFSPFFPTFCRLGRRKLPFLGNTEPSPFIQSLEEAAQGKLTIELKPKVAISTCELGARCCLAHHFTFYPHFLRPCSSATKQLKASNGTSSTRVKPCKPASARPQSRTHGASPCSSSPRCAGAGRGCSAQMEGSAALSFVTSTAKSRSWEPRFADDLQ